VVIETVGESTWSHSLRALKRGGRIVVSGATTGSFPPADLSRVFFLQLQIIGSTMGTRTELRDLMTFMVDTNLRPRIDRVIDLPAVPSGLRAMLDGTLVGKIAVEI
jgi:D-arabinose 1-dehydrogenase-like Zn-dependent alcohol dehydrogenase